MYRQMAAVIIKSYFIADLHNAYVSYLTSSDQQTFKAEIIKEIKDTFARKLAAEEFADTRFLHLSMIKSFYTKWVLIYFYNI